MATPIGLEPTISCVTGRHVNHYTTGPCLYSIFDSLIRPKEILFPSIEQDPSNYELRQWWAMTGSNRRHPACKAGALPAELITRELTIISIHKKGQCVKAFL